MNFLRPLLIAGVAVWGLQYWHQHHFADAQASGLPTADEYGFVNMPPVEGQKPDTVYVLLGRHSSRVAAHRATQLVEDLTSRGIAVVRMNSVTFAPVGLLTLDESKVNRVNALMSAHVPIVFVHGKAKVAATAEEVEAEFTGSPAPEL